MVSRTRRRWRRIFRRARPNGREKGVASATGSPIDNALHGFGGMAMQGSREAYLMNMMSRFGVTEGRDEQLDVLKEIRDNFRIRRTAPIPGTIGKILSNPVLQGARSVL